MLLFSLPVVSLHFLIKFRCCVFLTSQSLCCILQSALFLVVSLCVGGTSLLKAYTVNNTADLCGGPRFSWSEWISLSALQSCSLSKEKNKGQPLARIKHAYGILKLPL